MSKTKATSRRKRLTRVKRRRKMPVEERHELQQMEQLDKVQDDSVFSTSGSNPETEASEQRASEVTSLDLSSQSNIDLIKKLAAHLRASKRIRKSAKGAATPAPLIPV